MPYTLQPSKQFPFSVSGPNTPSPNALPVRAAPELFCRGQKREIPRYREQSTDTVPELCQNTVSSVPASCERLRSISPALMDVVI